MMGSHSWKKKSSPVHECGDFLILVIERYVVIEREREREPKLLGCIICDAIHDELEQAVIL